MGNSVLSVLRIKDGEWGKMSRLIDADSLIGELHNTYLYGSDARSAIYEKIDEQPTIDAVPVKHGHWEETPIPIWLRNNTTRTYYFKCNKCSSTSWNSDNYCSHCGAKMDEVTE